MRALRIAREGARALLRHKLRTFFMMAGTVVGIAALVVIMAIGKGVEKRIMKRLSVFSPSTMMLIAGGGKDLPPPDMSVTTLTLDDADAIREEIEGVEMVSPMAWSFRTNAKRDANQYQTMIWGVEPNWHDSWNWYTADGDGISDQDVAATARVCVIGRTLKRELFGDEDPLGDRIYVNNVSLTVKGVLDKRGASPMGGDFDNRVIIPITTAMRRVMNVDHVGAIRIIINDASLMPEQSRAVRALIHERHHITPPEEDDFRIITPGIIIGFVRGATRTLTVLLVALAGLSLIVGGVVLMNILLISVGERTREIGLRRATGATRGDIFTQFLTESLSVTVFGMLLGAVIGWAVCTVLANATEMPVAVSWQPFALGILFALIVGTLFGVHPARKAARLHPVEALRG